MLVRLGALFASLLGTVEEIGGQVKALARAGRLPLAVVVATLVIAGGALAATGALTPQGCIADAGSAIGCATTQQGLDGAEGVAVSPDGNSVYVASELDNAIVRFDRNTTTRALTPQGCIADPPDAAGCATTQQGLDAPFDVAVSADGKSVYVASALDDAIVRFDRNTTSGALSPQGCVADAGSAIGCATTQQGLDGAAGVAVSGDGQSAYAASNLDDAIVRFDRNTTSGALGGQGCIADAGSAIGCATTQQGLDAATGVAVSADDGSVYVASFFDAAIVRFDREVFVAPPPPSVTTPPTATGQRAAALKKCKKKRSAKARRKCRKRANLLPA